MKFLEIILWFVVLVGIIMKFLHLPGTGIVLNLSLGLLSLFYFVATFFIVNGINKKNKHRFKTLNGFKIPISIAAGFCMSILCIGILFSIMLFPGAEMNLLLGIIGTFAVIIITLFFWKKTDLLFRKRLFIRTALTGFLGLILFLLPYNLKMEIYYGEYPEYIEAVKKLKEDPNNEALQKKVNEEREKMINQ